MTGDQQIKDRVRKLLRVAHNDAATEGEIENALRFAKALIDKHHLREEDLSEEPADQRAAIMAARRSRVFNSVGTKVYAWEGMLANFCGDFIGGVGCYADHRRTIARDHRGLAMLSGGRAYRGKRICFYGITEDAELAAEIYHELRMTIIAMARLKFGGCYKGDGGTYCEGFVAGLASQLRERDRQQHLAVASDSRALVLLHRRQDLIDLKTTAAEAWLSLGGTKLGKVKSAGASGCDEAWLEGRADGSRSNIEVHRRRKIVGY